MNARPRVTVAALIERERHRSPLVWRCVEDYLSGRRHALDILNEYA